jgi:lysophospholipid acyltransferase (LPLAT)-like uncharacterized protein
MAPNWPTPAAVAESRRTVLDNWDRSEVNLPFSRSAIIVGESIRIAKDGDTQTLERARGALENTFNTETERAHAIVDCRS